MPKYTIEIRQIYEVEANLDEDWGEVLDNALKLYYTTGVEVDKVTLFSQDVEVIDIEGEPDEESENE
jgi:hypothetical protein